MSARRLAALCLTTVLCAAARPAAAGQYTYTALHLPNNAGSQGSTDINGQGQWLGTNIPPNAGVFQTFIQQAGKVRVLGAAEQLYLYSNLTSKGVAAGMLQTNGAGVIFSVATGKTTLLPHPPNLTVEPVRVNESGAVAGGIVTNTGMTRGYLFSGGKVTLLDYPGATMTYATAINAAGTVAGIWQVGQAAPHGFTWKAGKFTRFDVAGATYLTVNGIDSADRVIGSYQDAANATHGFIATGAAGRTFDYPGGRGSYLSNFGPAGQLIGNTFDANQTSTSHGFIFAGGHFTLVNYPGASPSGTTIAALNSAGTLVGGFMDAAGAAKAFIATCPAAQAPCTK